MTTTFWNRCLAGLASAGLLAMLPGCLGIDVDDARGAIPFLPPSKYVNVGGRKLTRAEVAYYQKIKDLSYATKVNPRDAVAYNAIGELFQKKGNFSLAKDLYYKAVSIDETLSEPHVNLGVIMIHEERFNGAVDELALAKQYSPDDAKIRHRLGQAFVGLAKFKEAIKEFDAAIALDEEYTPAYLDKAKLMYSQRRYAEASGVCRTALTKVPKADPTTAKAKQVRGNGILDRFIPVPNVDVEEETPPNYAAEASYNLALCLKAQGQISEALSALAGAELHPPAKADVQMLKARLQDASGNTAGAIGTLDLLRKDFPNIAEIPKRMAKLYQKSGQTDLAIKIRLEAAELDHSDRQLQEEAANHAEQTKDVARVIQLYERLVRVAPEEVRYHRALAKAYDSANLQRQAALTYQTVVNLDPNDIATRRRVGLLFADLPGFQGRAVLQFKIVLEKNPKDAEVHRKLGELYLKTRNFLEAEKHIRETLAQNPKDFEAHNNLATLYAGQNRLEDAATEYRAALAIDPKFKLAKANLAKALLKLDRPEEAVVTLREYIALEPKEEDPRRLLADTLKTLKREDEAIAEYEAIAALKPKDVSAQMENAKLQTSMGRREQAIGIYETILEKNPADFRALRETGKLYTEMKKPLRAIYIYQRMLTLKPSDMEAQTRLAECYNIIGSEEAAIEAYARVGKAGDAEAWRAKGLLHLRRNERELAMESLRETFKIKPRDIESRRMLGILLQESPNAEDDAEALAQFQEILKIEPTDLRARLNAANLLNEANRLSEAQDEYETILREKADHVPARLGLGVILRKRGKYQPALEQYLKALEADGNLKVAHYNAGLIYDYYLKDPPKARNHFQRFLELGGDPAKLPEKETPASTETTPGKPTEALAKKELSAAKE